MIIGLTMPCSGSPVAPADGYVRQGMKETMPQEILV